MKDASTAPGRDELETRLRALIRATYLDADKRPAAADRHASVTTALRQLDEQARIDPLGERTLVLALKARDLLLVERLAASGKARDRSAAAQAAGQLRAGNLDHDPELVRAWAREQGLTVPTRGRYLPRPIVDAWRQAQGAA
jgi:hypothetical protein